MIGINNNILIYNDIYKSIAYKCIFIINSMAFKIIFNLKM
jgi:hypothetical protein